jgi:glycosyltransferase involved in cell wall biosynthesis
LPSEGLRILLVANTLPPTDISGVGEQVLQLAAGLRSRGHEVEVLGRGEEGARGPKLLFPIAVLPAFLRRWRRFRPHVVQVHESDGALVALATAILGGVADPRPLLVALLQVSYVEEIRAVRPLTASGRVIGRPGTVERRFKWLKAPIQVVFGCLTAWLADLVLTPSLATAAEVRRDYQVDRIECLPNVTGGLEVEPASPSGEEAGFFLFVGRLRIRKGVEVLLEAMSLLAGQGSAARLMIVGDGEHLQPLRELASRLELDGTVLFAGRRSAPEVRSLLAEARALVVPSIYEGMPLVVLEAMEAERPVIASAVSGIPEVVVDGETGWLVPQEDPERLAAALDEAYAHPAEAARRGLAGAHRVEQLYRPGTAAETWIEIVDSSGRLVEEHSR